MGGSSGGKGQKQTGTTTTSTSLPSYAAPYYDRLLQRAEGESYRPYQPYGARRIADRSQDVLTGEGMTRSLAGSGLGGIGEGMDIYRQAGANAGNIGNYDPSQFSASNVNASPVNVDGISADQWGPEAASRYMSPYIENVLDTQRNRAFHNRQRLQLDLNNKATTTGNFNSARHGVIDAMGNEELTRQLSDIDATGMNQAWNQAQGMFSSDRDAKLLAARASMEGRLQGGIANQGQSIEAQRANQEAMLRAQQYGEQSRQFGGGLGMQGLASQMDAARGLMSGQQFGESQQFGRINALTSQGLGQFGYDQNALDLAYNDYINQRDSNRQNLNYLGQTLGGVPITPEQQADTYQNRSPGSAVAGMATAGIGALGSYLENR